MVGKIRGKKEVGFFEIRGHFGPHALPTTLISERS